MKKIFVYMALASLALTACHTKEYFENDGIPVEPEPEPEIVYEGEGNLEKENKDGSVAETNSTYTWKAEGTSITIDAYIDTGQYIHGDDEFGGGEYCIGWFTLPIATMNEFLGLDVRADLTAATFWAVNPDGTKVDSFTSYAPGMWVDDTGASSNWSAGSAFWQWYVWEDQGVTYDMSQGDYPGIIYLSRRTARSMTGRSTSIMPRPRRSWKAPANCRPSSGMTTITTMRKRSSASTVMCSLPIPAWRSPWR